MTTPTSPYQTPGTGGVHAPSPPTTPPAAAAPPPPPPADPSASWQRSPDGQYKLNPTTNQWEPNTAPAAPPPAPAAPPASAVPGAPAPQANPWGDTQAGLAELPPEMRQQLEDEVNQYGGSGGDFDDVLWFEPNKPQRIGETAESFVRILPHWENDAKPYWHRQHRHFCNIRTDQGIRRLPRVCPKENARPPQQPQPCPFCEREERAAAAGDKDLAGALKVKPRFYLNVIDGQHMEKHHVQDKATGQPKVMAMAWGVSPTLFKKITAIVAARGRIYDRNTGTWIKVMTTKVGKSDMEVRYDAIDVGGPAPLPQGFEQIGLNNLESLDAVKSYQELAAEVQATYPDQAGVPMAAPPVGGAPAGGAPWGNPYGQQPPQQPAQPWNPPAGTAGPPPGAAAPSPPAASPPAAAAPPPPAAPPAAAAPPAPPVAPPPAAAAPPPPAAAAAPPPSSPPAQPAWQVSPDGKWKLNPTTNQWEANTPGDDDIPF